MDGSCLTGHPVLIANHASEQGGCNMREVRP
jgi:hypothetical protein